MKHLERVYQYWYLWMLALFLAACQVSKLTPPTLAVFPSATPIITNTAIPPTETAISPTATMLKPTTTPTRFPAPTTYKWVCWGSDSTSPCQPISLYYLKAITFVADNDAWAVGENGYIMHWDGRVWEQVKSPTAETLSGVSFIGPDNGWAVSDGAKILHWDGKEWNVVNALWLQGQPPDSSSATLFYLNAVAFAGSEDGWAVGGIGTESGPRALIFHWNGEKWQEIDSICGCSLTAVATLSPDDVWVVGGGEEGATFHWDGVHWQRVSNPAPYWLYSVSAISFDNVWAAGLVQQKPGSSYYDGNVIHWNGQQWIEINVPPPTGPQFQFSIVMLSETDGWSGGYDLFHWTGREWVNVENPANKGDRASDWIVDIEVSPNRQVWAITRAGKLLQLIVSK